MADIKTVINDEIKRLARKEIKAAMKPLHARVSEMRKIISEQAKQIKMLKTSVRNLCKQTEKTKSPITPTAPSKQIRLNAEGIKRIRAKLGISQTEFAKLLDASPISVSHWELGKSKPRELFVRRIVALRGVKRRDLE